MRRGRPRASRIGGPAGSSRVARSAHAARRSGLILVGLALGAEPVLGPRGWTVLGPLGDHRDPVRDEVVFDLRTCAVEIARVDLDGGPANRDVRLARRWTNGRWEWEDDWRVKDGQLLRPGRDPIPLPADGVVQGEHLGFDGSGRITSRERLGRTLEITRDPQGLFIGMRAGPAWVRVEGNTGRSWTGEVVQWRWESGELRTVSDAGGLLSAWSWSRGAPAALRWSDGSSLVFQSGSGRSSVRGLVSASCERKEADRVALTLPDGDWSVAYEGKDILVTDPGGAVVRTRRGAGGLMGWVDPRGGETRIERDGAGRIVAVGDPGGARWALRWEGGLAAVEGPDGATWAFAGEEAGSVRVTDPTGREATWSRVAGGAIRGVSIGSSRWDLARDGVGRLTSIADPTGSKVELTRDVAGRVVGVRDPSGASWNVLRDGVGRIVGMEDPGSGSWRFDRDGLGRVVGLRAPEGERIKWSWRPDGAPGAVERGGSSWSLLWSDPGALSGIRDPLGGTWGFERDRHGAVRAVRRPDGEVVRLDRDAAGDIVRAGAVGVRRDASGRAQGLPELQVWWDRDGSGRVVGVTAPGVTLRVEREPGGAIRAVVAGDQRVELTRDGQGRVVAARGDTEVRLGRDAAGRIVRVDADGVVRVERDVRGLTARVRHELGGVVREWIWGRDALGRVVRVEGPGASLGVDRDGLGRAALVRFGDGSLARLERVDGEVRARWVDRDGRERAASGWTTDPLGRLARLVADGVWLLRRDPNGVLVAVEQGERAWSRAPDGIEGPNEAFLRYDAQGRPASARGVDPWGLGGDLTYTLGAAGEVLRVTGARGAVRLAYDAVGRLVEARGPSGQLTVVRDALGRITRVGRRGLGGWEEARFGAGPEVAVDGVAETGKGLATLFAPDGTPLVSLTGPEPFTPTGARAGGGWTAGPRLAAGPLFGLSEARDPLSGQDLGPALRFPWVLPTWEPALAPGPDADPDGSAEPAWDAGPWAPESPWSDPLALLVAAGELSGAGPRAVRSPGLPWLPGSLAPEAPAVVPDPFALALDEEPLVRMLVEHLRAPTRAPALDEVAGALVPLPIPRLPPGLEPPAPY